MSGTENHLSISAINKNEETFLKIEFTTPELCDLFFERFSSEGINKDGEGINMKKEGNVLQISPGIVVELKKYPGIHVTSEGMAASFSTLGEAVNFYNCLGMEEMVQSKKPSFNGSHYEILFKPEYLSQELKTILNLDYLGSKRAAAAIIPPKPTTPTSEIEVPWIPSPILLKDITDLFDFLPTKKRNFLIEDKKGPINVFQAGNLLRVERANERDLKHRMPTSVSFDIEKGQISYNNYSHGVIGEPTDGPAYELLKILTANRNEIFSKILFSIEDEKTFRNFLEKLNNNKEYGIDTVIESTNEKGEDIFDHLANKFPQDHQRFFSMISLRSGPQYSTKGIDHRDYVAGRRNEILRARHLRAKNSLFTLPEDLEDGYSVVNSPEEEQAGGGIIPDFKGDYDRGASAVGTPLSVTELIDNLHLVDQLMNLVTTNSKTQNKELAFENFRISQNDNFLSIQFGQNMRLMQADGINIDKKTGTIFYTIKGHGFCHNSKDGEASQPISKKHQPIPKDSSIHKHLQELYSLKDRLITETLFSLDDENSFKKFVELFSVQKTIEARNYRGQSIFSYLHEENKLDLKEKFFIKLKALAHPGLRKEITELYEESNKAATPGSSYQDALAASERGRKDLSFSVPEPIAAPASLSTSPITSLSAADNGLDLLTSQQLRTLLNLSPKNHDGLRILPVKDIKIMEEKGVLSVTKEISLPAPKKSKTKAPLTAKIGIAFVDDETFFYNNDGRGFQPDKGNCEGQKVLVELSKNKDLLIDSILFTLNSVQDLLTFTREFGIDRTIGALNGNQNIFEALMRRNQSETVVNFRNELLKMEPEAGELVEAAYRIASIACHRSSDKPITPVTDISEATAVNLGSAAAIDSKPKSHSKGRGFFRR